MKRNIAIPGSSGLLILIIAVGFLLLEIAGLLIMQIHGDVNGLNNLLINALM